MMMERIFQNRLPPFPSILITTMIQK